MAVDSRNKRFSIMTLGKTIQPIVMTPDGTIAQADRQALLWGYSGILWQTTIGIQGKLCVTISGLKPEITITGVECS